MESRRTHRQGRLLPVAILAFLPSLTLFTPVAAAGQSAHAGASVPAASARGAADLPVGDGRVSDHPEAGNVYACRTTFRNGGARHDGPWFHGGTWDPTEKPHVRGHVLWPDAAFSLTPAGGDVEVRGNGLPLREPTGVFPIAPSDPVFRYDTNPNHVGAQDLDFRIPAEPATAARPSCLPMGMIGFTVTGVALYSALDDAGRDAAAHEIQDACDGHPQANAQYHYHGASPCIPGIDGDGVVGWALDGFPILGTKDHDGAELTDADLDACHGRRERVVADGRSYAYAYHFTREYPYTLGCFTGAVLDSTLRAVRAGLQPSRRGRRRRGGAGEEVGPPGGER